MATLTTAVGTSATLRTSGSVSSNFSTSDNILDQANANVVLCSLDYAAPATGGQAIVRFEDSPDGSAWTEVTTKDEATGLLKPFEVRVSETAVRSTIVPKSRRFFRSKDRGAGTLAVNFIPQQQIVFA